MACKLDGLQISEGGRLVGVSPSLSAPWAVTWQSEVETAAQRLAPIGISHLLLRISSGVSMDRRLAPVRTSHDARRNPRPPRLLFECHMMRGKDRCRHASGHAYLAYEGRFRPVANIYLAYEGLTEPPKHRKNAHGKARNRGIPTTGNQGNIRQEPLVTQIDVRRPLKPPLVSEIADPNNPS
jgi:hypothetical protein